MSELGAFSVSLSVKDLQVSREFYENLGFEKIGGDGANFLILQNGPSIIGLFQGMFEGNILTFNPGWSGPHEEAESFTDVREIEADLKEKGIAIHSSNTADNASGPANIMIADPDGNVILLDQHRS